MLGTRSAKLPLQTQAGLAEKLSQMKAASWFCHPLTGTFAVLLPCNVLAGGNDAGRRISFCIRLTGNSIKVVLLSQQPCYRPSAVCEGGLTI